MAQVGHIYAVNSGTMRTGYALLPLFLLACAGSGTKDSAEPMSAAEHLAEAERHEREAAQLDDRPADTAGGDVSPTVAAVSTVSTSGGAPLTQPRWTYSLAPTMEYRAKAKRLREEAAEHRRIAEGLMAAEKRACAGLRQEDIDLGPFFHRHDIKSVSPVKDKGTLRGARIRFAIVPELTVAWMERAVECAHARAAVLGYPDDYMKDSPLMLDHVSAAVRQAGAQIEVEIVSAKPLTAAAILGRAEALLQRQKAEPAKP